MQDCSSIYMKIVACLRNYLPVLSAWVIIKDSRMSLTFNSIFLLKTLQKYQVLDVIKITGLGAHTNPLVSMDQECSTPLKITHHLITFLGMPMHLSPDLTGSHRYLDWFFNLPGAETAIKRPGAQTAENAL